MKTASFLAGALLMALCSAPFSAMAATPKDTLLFVRESGGNSYDIQGIGTNRSAYGLSWNVYDRLVTYGTKKHPNGSLMYDYRKIEPALAESWEISDDGLEITFHLRKDAVFHDGSPVTAEDVKWSFDRAVSVGGFPTFQMSAGSLVKPEQFTVVDTHTFRVTLPKADKLALPDIGTPVPAIYNSKLAKKHATEKDPWALEWLKMNDAGSGAYKVKSFKPGVQTVYERFDGWKCGPLPAMKTVIERVVPSAATRRAMLEKGDVDLSLDLPPKDFAELASNEKIKVEGVPVENCMWFVDMNVTKAPFDNPKVREAISYAIPYQAVYDTATFGRAAKLWGAENRIPATSEWLQPYPYKYDPAKAKALLAEAGYPDGFKTTLSFSLGKASLGEPAALVVQEGLKSVGIEATLNKVPGANWRTACMKKDMPMLVEDMGGWLNYCDYFFYWNYHSQNGVFNTMSYQNAEMDGYIEAARFAKTPEEYDAAVKNSLAKAFADAPRLPLFQPNFDVAMQKNVNGYQYWFVRQLDFRTITKD